MAADSCTLSRVSHRRIAGNFLTRGSLLGGTLGTQRQRRWRHCFKRRQLTGSNTWIIGECKLSPGFDSHMANLVSTLNHSRWSLCNRFNDPTWVNPVKHSALSNPGSFPAWGLRGTRAFASFVVPSLASLGRSLRHEDEIIRRIVGQARF